jgi:hypothetical protein
MLSKNSKVHEGTQTLTLMPFHLISQTRETLPYTVSDCVSLSHPFLSLLVSPYNLQAGITGKCQQYNVFL